MFSRTMKRKNTFFISGHFRGPSTLKWLADYCIRQTCQANTVPAGRRYLRNYFIRKIFIKMTFLAFLAIVISTTPFAVNAVSLEKELRSRVLDGYDRWTRPVEKYEDVINVTYEASIYQIADFDAKAETLSTLIWPVVCWNDAFIHWQPQGQYQGIEVIRVSQEEIWTPDIVPYNDVGKWDTRKYKDNVPIMVQSNGRVCWQIPIIMETICSMDVTNFPYDEQVCQISLGSWQYSYKEVKTLCSRKHMDKSTFTPNSQWELMRKLLLFVFLRM